ncbi:unnamed protein product [Larinioides sclopetarius]|uniref:Uncharacterized protein n=1 Tax=Larinioides sclopetarius TaxID=280406 RepID=A0AAV1ZPG5_9ARAC
MNSKSMLRIWQKNFRKEIGSLINVTDRLRNCGHNWKPNNWLMEVVPGATGMLQNGIMTGKQWIDSKIASQMNWSIDMYHDQGQMSKMDNLKIKESIQKLHELREKLDKVCVGANYGKAAGNSAEILGAGGVITGALMSLYELPSGPNITKIGNLVHYGGTFVDNSSKVIESCFSKKYLKEVLAVLKENKEISKAMGKWLEYTEELDANVKAIIRVSQKEVLSIILEICNEFRKLTSSGIGMNEDLNFMKQGKYITYIWSDVQIALLLVIIMKLYNNMCASPLLVDKIRSVLSDLNIKPKNVKILIQILIASYNFLEIYSSLDCESVSEVDLDAHHESDADPETNLKVGLKADSEVDLDAHHESDAEADPETNLKVDLKVDSEVDAKYDPEINTACTRRLPFRAMSLAYSFNSLIDAASNIRRGESQYSDALKGIIKTLERELKFIKKV